MGQSLVPCRIGAQRRRAGSARRRRRARIPQSTRRSAAVCAFSVTVSVTQRHAVIVISLSSLRSSTSWIGLLEADGRLAVEAEQGLRRVDEFARDRGDVGQAEEAVVDAEIHRPKAFLRDEPAADAQAHAFGSGLYDARWCDRILLLQALDHRLLVDPEAGDLLGREVEVDDLVLQAEEFDPASGRHLGNFPQAFSPLALIEAAARIILADRLEEWTG